MTAQNNYDVNGNDEEALSSLPIDMSNFTIDDSSVSSREEEYDSITNDSAPPTPITPGNDDGNAPLTPGHDFALAVRTSEIISSYRDFLSEVESELETASAKNVKLTDEMNSIRGSLGQEMQQSASTPPGGAASYYYGKANIHIYEESCQEAGLFVSHPVNKYSQPLLHSRIIKRRLLGALITIAIVGCIVTFTSEVSKHNAKLKKEDLPELPDWNQELADVLKEESENKKESTPSKADEVANSKWHARVSTKRPGNKSEESSPAMQMIDEIIHSQHPEDIHVNVVEAERTTVPGPDEGSAIVVNMSKSGKSTTHSSSTTKSKSGKGIGMKSESKGSKSSKAPTIVKSKSAKSLKSDSSTSQITGSTTETRSINLTPTSSTIASFSIIDTSSENVVPQEETAIEEAQHIKKKERLHLEAAHILYQRISSKYNPKFYSRSEGNYQGYTFSDAIQFCKDHYPEEEDEKHGVPCGYQVYCPEGPNTVPFGGYEAGVGVGDGGMYAPIVSAEEHWIGWVQLNEEHSCVAYNMLDPEPTVEQTGHIMCCKDVDR